MPVTIRDVAKAAGVSPSTVSRTIRKNSTISKKTQDRVWEAIQQTGYEIPESARQNLEEETSESHSIGVILPPSMKSTYENPFFLEVLRGISLTCSKQDVLTLLITGQDDEEIIRGIQDAQNEGSAGAFIVLFSRQDDPIVDYLYSQGVEYVLVGSPAERINETVCVDNDNIAAGQQAASYLYNLGHRRFCFVGSEDQQLYSTARKNGFRLFLAEKNIEFDPDLIVEMEYGDEKGLKKLRSILMMESGKRPTAFITSDDLHAVTLKQLAGECGLHIPEDFSVVSFNNSVFSRLTLPQLTSIDVNAAMLGSEAASQAMAHASNPALIASKTLIPFSLVERDSTASNH